MELFSIRIRRTFQLVSTTIAKVIIKNKGRILFHDIFKIRHFKFHSVCPLFPFPDNDVMLPIELVQGNKACKGE